MRLALFKVKAEREEGRYEEALNGIMGGGGEEEDPLK